MKKGKLIIYTGCSGVGKGTIMKKMLEVDDTIRLSVSCTTRAPRPGEVDGVHYYFVSKPEFETMIANDEFLEYAPYCENYYGTPAKAVEEMLDSGLNVLLEIEVQGGLQIMEKHPEALSIFICPPSMEELERRLRGRGTEDEATIKLRLNTALEEMTYADKYSYNVLNDDASRAADEILNIIHNN